MIAASEEERAEVKTALERHGLLVPDGAAG
jgi:hypothetical protein